MYISVKSDYALQAIFDLAAQRPGEPVRIADIARRQKIPQKFLELILAGLKQAGFVESRRGAEGGYLLARPPESLTRGRSAALRGRACAAARATTARQAETPFTGMWEQVDQAVSGCGRPHHLRRPAARLEGKAKPLRPQLGDLS